MHNDNIPKMIVSKEQFKVYKDLFANHPKCTFCGSALQEKQGCVPDLMGRGFATGSFYECDNPKCPETLQRKINNEKSNVAE